MGAQPCGCLHARPGQIEAEIGLLIDVPKRRFGNRLSGIDVALPFLVTDEAALEEVGGRAG
jgi:hypothetical protein